ncbi:MAG: hypothetical protein EBQ72_00025, partial [Actinobacteria bacterium]|nr:hypothetical protein [Actinomycetota bacterium]
MPDAPVAPTVGTRMKTWTSLSWRAPDNGGEVIDGYSIRYSRDSGSTWTVVPASSLTRDSVTALSATVRGLTPSTNYVFQVAASNVEGLGPWSASSNVGNTSSVPNAPTSVSVSAKTQSSVSLSWTAAVDNGSAITDYKVEFSDDGVNWQVFDDGVSANTSVTVTGLSRSVGYVFRVSAINANGMGLSGLALGAKMMSSSGSADHFCVVKADQSVSCWGRNDYGQLGVGSYASLGGGFANGSGAPVQGWAAGSAVSVAAGQDHTCIATVDGVVKCVGRGDSGQLGNGASSNNTSAVTVTGISTATSVIAGVNFSCALLADTTVQCWGDNAYGQLGNGSNTASNSPVIVKGLTNVSAVSAGDHFACALLTNKAVKCWGKGLEGQIGNGGNLNTNVPLSVTGLSNVQGITTGAAHACALLADSTIQCWGYNSNGQLGDGTTTNRINPVQVTGIGNAASISAGGLTSCATLLTGAVSCWGLNNQGQLGNGTTTESSTPVTVAGLTNATTVAVSQRASCALLADNKLRCWGRSTIGQLGDGNVKPVYCNQYCYWGIYRDEASSTTPVVGLNFATLDA